MAPCRRHVAGRGAAAASTHCRECRVLAATSTPLLPCMGCSRCMTSTPSPTHPLLPAMATACVQEVLNLLRMQPELADLVNNLQVRAGCPGCHSAEQPPCA